MKRYIPRETPHVTLTEKEACQYTGFSRPWFRQGRMHGRGPAYVRVGRSIRYLVADLDAWLAEHRIDPSRRRVA